MRIRKNAKLSPLLFSSSSSSSLQVPEETFQTHVCQLNQSPWDVIPFDSDSIQLELRDTGNNGSAADSFGPVESVASMMDAEVKVEDTMAVVVDDNHDNSKVVLKNNANKGAVWCQGFDGKGWPCKNETRQGQSLCDQHLSLLRSYNNNSNNTGCNSKKPVTVSVTASRRGARARSAAKKASTAASSNPYEFYYYSGFGPLWGKRRGDRNGEGSSRNNIGGVGGGENSTTMESDDNVVAVVPATAHDVVDNNNDNNTLGVGSTSEMDTEELVYEDDEEEEDDSGKKRTRKPVKARSLKSLM